MEKKRNGFFGDISGYTALVYGETQQIESQNLAEKLFEHPSHRKGARI